MSKFLAFLMTLSLGGASTQANDALLITSDKLAAAWQDFVNWKAKGGITVRVQTVQEIDRANRTAGIDVQEKIRRYVSGQKTDRLKWVILGGDSLPDGKGVVPDRDTPHRVMGLPRPKVPTDLYYLSEKDWDADDDDVYGEFPDDRFAIDYSKLSIGRIPVRTAKEVADYTSKVIEYEIYQPSEEYQNRMVYTCAVPSAEPKLETSWKMINKSWSNGTRQYLFTRRSSWDRTTAGDYDLSPRNFIDIINQKQFGKFHIHGHGLNHCWVLEGDEKLTTSALGGLNNKGAYPVITTVSCFTGQFDSSRDPSITEGLLRLPNAGAIVIIAPSREGKPHFLDRRDMRKMVTEGKMDGTTELLTKFWINALDGELSMGEAFAKAKSDYYEWAGKSDRFHMLACEVNLLGDPTLKLK